MVIAAIAGYLIGSIPIAVLIGRKAGIDPRNAGDFNPGWWNVRALMGDRLGAFVLVGDIAKGVAAAAVGSALWGPWWWAYLAVFAAMLGHAFPLFARFRGGRSILTFVGGLALITPFAAAIAIVIGVIAGLIRRRFDIGARWAMVVFPLVQLTIDPIEHVAWTGACMTLIGLRFWAARSYARATVSPG